MSFSLHKNIFAVGGGGVKNCIQTMRYYNSLIKVGANNRKRLGHLGEENLKLDNERYVWKLTS